MYRDTSSVDCAPRMSDHTLSIRDFSSPLKTDACSIILIALFQFEKSCWIHYFFSEICYFIPGDRICIIRYIFQT